MVSTGVFVSTEIEMVMINLKQDFLSSNSVSNHTRDKQIGLPLRGRPILLITRMITDPIGLHSVLLPLFITLIRASVFDFYLYHLPFSHEDLQTNHGQLVRFLFVVS